MVRRRRIGSSLWLFLLVLALGVGWAAHQEWRWPFLGLLDRESETEQASAPEADEPVTDDSVAEQAPDEQLAVADSAAETILVEPGPEPAAPPPAEAEAETMSVATGPAAPAERDVAEEDLAAEAMPEQAEAASDAAGTSPEPSPEPADVEVAAPQADPAPAESESAVLEADPETAPSGPAEAVELAEAVASEPSQDSPEQEPAPELAALADEGEAAGASVASTSDSPGPESETEAESAPSFDIVRVGRDGRAVIAGRAAPGAEVEVRSGGQVIDRVQATRRGEWVAIPARPLAPGDQELSAVATQAGAAVESAQVVVVAVPEPTSPTPPADAAARPEPIAPQQPVAVLLPRDHRGSGRILQAPGRLSAEGTLALMTVSYDERGEVLLSGEAPPGVPVRIYVDNRPAALVVGDAKGGWTSGLDEALAPGTYTLRLDQLGADGQTVARIETPFTRVSEPPVEGNLQVDYVVVQPGNSLWRIARRLSGKGLDYVHIYDANQAQIRNPDLIYPGQVFEIPAVLDTSG